MQGIIKDTATIIGEDNKEYSYGYTDLKRIPYNPSMLGKKVDFVAVENKATMIFEAKYYNPNEFPLIQSFKRYFDFSGRSSRKEFWVTSIILNAILAIFAALEFFASEMNRELSQIIIFWMIFGLATFIPLWSVAIRRLHDLNSSGWWILISLLPILGTLILIVAFLSPGTKRTNKYGLNPLYYPDSQKK